MSGHTVYPQDRQRECAQRGYHLFWFKRLVRPNSAATMMPSELRDVCLHCGVTP